MTFLKFILLTALLFGACCGRAQDSNYVYQDTAIMYQDSVAADAAAQDSEAADLIADTVLTDNQLTIESDSVRALKKLKQFDYAKNLDSLLNVYQLSLQKDQAVAVKQISWIARFFLSPITKYFFLLLAVVFVFFILYRLFFAEGFLQKSFATIKEAPLAEEADIFSGTTDYSKLISQAISNKNYRMAVRYYYLQSLQKLFIKGAIQFAPDKTNYEYVQELSGKKYKNAFASLTLNYEYVWYGGFEIDENIFNVIQQKFKQFNSEV